MADDGGLSRIQKRFAAIPEAVRKAAEDAARKGAAELAKDMRTLALASKETGALIDSIVETPGGQATPPYSQPGGSTVVPEGSTMVTVGNSEVRYPHLVEYGTTKTAAQPYFWPAVRANSKRIRSRISRAVRKSVKDNWGK